MKENRAEALEVEHFDVDKFRKLLYQSKQKVGKNEKKRRIED